jgi:hypothetical protein
MHASSPESKNLSDLHAGFEKAAFHRPVLKMKQRKIFRFGHCDWRGQCVANIIRRFTPTIRAT